MAKFLFCLPRFHTNAVPWIELLRANGHEADVLVSWVGPTEYHASGPPRVIPRSRLEHLRPRPVPAIDAVPNISAVWREIRTADPDLVVVRGVTRWLSRVAALSALSQGRRLVVYDQEDPCPKARTTWARRAALRAIGVPHFTTRLGFFDQRPSGAGCAASIPFARPKWAPTKLSRAEAILPAPRLLMVAKYRPRKGHANLLKALSLLSAGHAFSLTFCGEEAGAADTEFCSELASLADSLGLSDRLEFVNNVPHEEMGRLYQGHDLFVLPSLNEPAAVSPIEAAWFGCSVLLSADSGTRGYIPPGQRFEFDPHSPGDIARAIEGVIATRASLWSSQMECRRYVDVIAGDGVVLAGFERLLGKQPRLEADA